MAFKFSKVEAATESAYLKPGVYKCKVSEVKLGSSKTKGTPSLDVTFTTENDLSITENFYLSEGALGRIQYLYQAWAGKKLDKDFESAEEVAAFFKKTFTSKAPAKLLIVGGEIDGTKVYARLPFTNFVTDDLEEGEFEEGDENYKKHVKVKNVQTAATGKKNGILNDSDDEKPADKKATKTSKKEEKVEEAADDDTPW